MAIVGFKARVLGFVRKLRDGVSVLEVNADPGGGPNVTLDVMGSSGDDSPPLNTDYVFGVPSNGTGRGVAVGFADPINAGEALAGEKRFVGRDQVGKIVCTIHMRRDGSVIFGNDFASVEVHADGAIDARNDLGHFALDADGAIEMRNDLGHFALDAAGAIEIQALTMSIGNAAGSMILDASGTWIINGVVIAVIGDVVTALGKSLNLHSHPQPNDSGGDTQVPTGPPL